MYVTTSSCGVNSCTAHITTSRNRSKVYGNSVYLKDGQRFEIELFNPNTIPYLAKISINGKPISTSGIVLKPGQRVYLERFIDSNNKFVFETYEIEKSNEALNAVMNNGLVEISFYGEQTISGYFSSYNTFTTNSPVSYYTNTGVYVTQGISGADGISFGGTTTSNFSCSISDLSLESKSMSKSIETGRVEKGESSNQDFNQTTGNFSSFPSSSISYRLTPESEKPVEIEKLRNYCTGCGNRIKKDTWKFCPSCGEKY
jgi:hypothetical protein